MSSGFETLNLHPQLKRAIDALGFKDMTPIPVSYTHLRAHET